eukprot:831011-Amphidinium_carterae.1
MALLALPRVACQRIPAQRGYKTSIVHISRVASTKISANAVKPYIRQHCRRLRRPSSCSPINE